MTYDILVSYLIGVSYLYHPLSIISSRSSITYEFIREFEAFDSRKVTTLGEGGMRILVYTYNISSYSYSYWFYLLLEEAFSENYVLSVVCSSDFGSRSGFGSGSRMFSRLVLS
jgi:hypothetical protein